MMWGRNLTKAGLKAYDLHFLTYLFFIRASVKSNYE